MLNCMTISSKSLDKSHFYLLNYVLNILNQNVDKCRYVLAIAILSTLYTGLQVVRQVHELSTSKEAFSRQNLALLEFFGDQVCDFFIKMHNWISFNSVNGILIWDCD